MGVLLGCAVVLFPGDREVGTVRVVYPRGAPRQGAGAPLAGLLEAPAAEPLARGLARGAIGRGRPGPSLLLCHRGIDQPRKCSQNTHRYVHFLFDATKSLIQKL